MFKTDKKFISRKPEVDIKIGQKRFEESGKNLAKEVEKDLGLGNLTSIERYSMFQEMNTHMMKQKMCKHMVQN